MRSTVRLLVLGIADVWALVMLRPNVARLTRHLAHPRDWTQRSGPDAAIVEVTGALVWLLALWLAIGLLAALAARGPGVLGRCGERVARTLLPFGIRRLVAGATGLGILIAPASAGAATPVAHAGVHVIAPAPTPAPTPGRPPLPAPAWPTSPTRPTTPLAARPATPPAPTAGVRVVVHPGDSLWLITATRLGPHASAAAVAAQWPRWYAANRATIGPDPNVLQPGQVLHAPDQGAA